MALDREDVFFRRILDLGLGDLLDRFKAKGFVTHNAFAFASDFTPGMGGASDQTLTPMLLAELAEGKDELLPSLRRLWWESWSLVSADMESRASSASGASVRNVSSLELETRRQAALAKVPGLTITKDLDVSDSFIKKIISMGESGVIRYPAWELVTTRSLETLGVTDDPAWKVTEDGRLRREPQGYVDHAADASTEYKLSRLLLRRSLALEMGDVMSYAVHEKLHARLMEARTKDPPSDSYERISFDMLIRADRAFWQLVAEKTRKGLKRAHNDQGERPADVAAREAMADEDFLVHLRPLPAPPAGTKRTASSANLAGGRQWGFPIRERVDPLEGQRVGFRGTRGRG